VRWPRDAWLDAFPNEAAAFRRLPTLLDRTIVELATSRLPQTKEGVLSAFVLSTAWGYGGNGYGPFRAARILSAAGPTAAARLQTAARAVRREGALAGYRALAAPVRLKHLGPAFGTKFLFFQSAGHDRALIFDQLMSTWLEENCGLRLDATRWSSQTYAEYLRLMRIWAVSLEVEPATLEMAVFTDQATAQGGQWRARERDSLSLRPGDGPGALGEALRDRWSELGA
jgi:hypothetical protein